MDTQTLSSMYTVDKSIWFEGEQNVKEVRKVKIYTMLIPLHNPKKTDN